MAMVISTDLNFAPASWTRSYLMQDDKGIKYGNLQRFMSL